MRIHAYNNEFRCRICIVSYFVQYIADKLHNYCVQLELRFAKNERSFDSSRVSLFSRLLYYSFKL